VGPGRVRDAAPERSTHCNAGTCGDKAEIVGTIRRSAVTIRRQQLLAPHDEHPGKLPEHVTGLPTEPVRKCASRATNPDPRVEHVGKAGGPEAECPVVLQSGIAHARHVAQASAREPGIGLFRGGRMHERQLRSGRRDGRPRRGDIGQRLATEGSAERTQEHDEGRAGGRETGERRRRRIRDLGRPRRLSVRTHVSPSTHFSSCRASASNLRMPSDNFSTAIASWLCSQR
jgi:hypothetical protein